MKKRLIALLLAALSVTLLLAGCGQQEPEDQHWDAKPSVMIDGVLYGTTGYSATYRTDETPEHGGHVDGTITSTVEGYPTENDQSNFGTGYAYRWGEDGTVEVFFEKWVIFEAYEDTHEVNHSTVDPGTPPAEQFVFTRENFPLLNGSTSMVPLGQAIASVLLGETREEVADLINFSRTTQSYRQLMNGYADLLISGAPPESIYEEKDELGFEWEISTFAVDGLVFIVNEDNPVDSLTTEQIQKIYTGEITNWKEVGGDDVEIVPFQRNEEAGSQTAMKKLVMGDIPLMEAPAEYVSGAMGDLVEVVASYNDSAAAIGYTVYYYAHDMKMADALKIIAVDGVQPNVETIRSHEYPFINDSYVVVAAGLADDAPAKILYNWIMSEEGQKLVAHEGYVSALDVGDEP